MATDALGLTVALAKGYILAGTCRAIDGDVITLVLGDGSKSVRCTAGDLLNFADLAVVLSVLYQPKDDQLSAVAALSPSADKLDYWTSATAKALTDLTAYARTLIAAASARAAIDLLMPKGADVASATTTDLSATTGRFVHITGTTTITGLGTVAAGVERVVRFAGALTLTHNATSLVLPGAANITTAANDVAWFISEGSGNWRCLSYFRAGELLSMAQATIAGRASGAGTGAPTALSASQVATILSGLVTPAYHEHGGPDVALDDSAWVGALSGSGIRHAQDLADWLDANLVL